MEVTKLTQSAKVPDRWYLTLENGTEIKVNTALIADYSLYTGRELTDDETASLKADAGKAGAMARALRVSGSRALSRGELLDKLREKGETEENAEEAADRLEKIGALNDREYAGMVVRHYSAKGYGIGRVKNELFRRKVPKEYWEEALSEMPDITGAIDALVGSKLRRAAGDKKEIKKMTDSLLRRGFTWEEIKAAVERYGNSIGEFDDVG